MWQWFPPSVWTWRPPYTPFKVQETSRQMCSVPCSFSVPRFWISFSQWCSHTDFKALGSWASELLQAGSPLSCPLQTSEKGAWPFKIKREATPFFSWWLDLKIQLYQEKITKMVLLFFFFLSICLAAKPFSVTHGLSSCGTWTPECTSLVALWYVGS